MGRTRRAAREHGEGTSGRRRIITISRLLLEDTAQRAPGFALAPASAVVFTVYVFMDGLMLVVHVTSVRLPVVMAIEGHQ